MLKSFKEEDLERKKKRRKNNGSLILSPKCW